MRKKWFQKTMALVLTGCMVMQTPASVMAETAPAPEVTQETSPDSETAKKATPTPKETPQETPKETPKTTPKEASEIAPEATPTETPKTTPSETPKTTPSETPKEIPETSPTATPTETPKVEPVYADAKIQVSYSDEKNLANRRETNGDELLEVYADGAPMADQPSITMDKERPDEEKGSVQVYTYTIHGLSLYKEDGTTPITYTVREEKAPKGYTAFTQDALTNIENQEAAALLANYVSPDGEITLTADAENTLKAEKKFGNYLPAYEAAGTIIWPKAEELKSRPEMEAYFQNQFTITREGQPCTFHKITYTQDETDADKWNYEVKGLFTTKEDGTPASYEAEAAKIEGTTLEKSGDYDFTYTIAKEKATETPAQEKVQKAARAATVQEKSLKAGADAGETQTKEATDFEDHTMSVVWYPNNKAVRDDYVAEQSIYENVIVTFTIGDGTAQDLVSYLVDDNKKAELKALLGLSENQSVPEIIHTSSGTYDVFTVHAPTKINTTESDGTVTSKEVTWTIKDNWADFKESTEVNGIKYLPAEYHEEAYEGRNNVYVHKQDSGFHFDLEILNGGADDETAAEGFLKDIILHAKVGDSIVDVTGNLDEGTITIDGREYTLSTSLSDNITEDTAVTVSGLPMFTEDDVEIIYYVDVNDDRVEIEDDTEDYYAAKYDNTYSSNFGSNIEETHDGGKLILTLTGKTEYTGTKIWLDDETSARPNTTWTLWRYSNKEGVDWTQAASVYDDKGDQITWNDIDKQENTTAYSTTGITEHLTDRLPKYDTDGYKYIYFVKEDMSGGDHYEKIFGSVDMEDNISDVGPHGTEGWSRESNDVSLYNGGTLSNRRTDTKTVTQEKTWIAKAHQSELEDVFVELTLYQSTLENGPWTMPAENDKGEAIIEYLNGFKPEEITKTAAADVPVYDKHGIPLYYQWVETGVYETPTGNYESEEAKKTAAIAAGNKLTNSQAEGGNKTFVLSHNRNADDTLLADGEEHYESYIDEEGVITNKLVGETAYIVKKQWNPDGTPPQGAAITWTLYQNGQPMSEYTNTTMDGSESWDELISELPKFDEDGAKYEYVAKEITCEPDTYGFSHYEYNKEVTERESGTTLTTNTAIMVNAPIGVGKTIPVRKQWIDDGDNASRKPVTVQVWRSAGKTEDDIGYERKLINGNVELNTGNDWWTLVDVTEYTLENGTPGTKEQWKEENPGTEPETENIFQNGHYYLKEIKVGESGTEQETERNLGVPCESMDLDDPEANANENGDQTQGRYIGTDQQIYYIDYVVTKEDGSDNDGYYTVTNRRIGVIDLTVIKTWVDGGKSQEKRAELEAKLHLKCTEQPGAVKEASVILDADSEANALKELSRPIQDKDGITVRSTQELRGGTNENPDTETIYFHNLPKYDAKGAVVHYDVEETSKATQGGNSEALKDKEYVVTMTSGYQVGPQHTDDQASIAVTNTRRATKNIKFHKRWIDTYRFKKGERPDIYLTLYQTEDNKIVETGYRDVKWDHLAGDNDMYNWTCTIADVPKYDDKGAEIFYYAEEGMHVNRYLLDYIDPRYFYEQKDYSRVTYDGGKYQVMNSDAQNDYVRQYTEGEVSKAVLKEGGTFVNELRSALEVSGKKVWKNVPSGLPLEDYPILQINVYQSTNKEDLNFGSGTADNQSPGPLVAQFRTDVTPEPNAGYTITQGNGTFSFKVTKGNATDYNYPDRVLPQYNDKGEKYFYPVREVVLDSEGLPIELTDPLNTAYEKLPGEVNDYVITNTYDIDNAVKNAKGEVTVTKDWDFGSYREEYENYPDITYTLYRQYVSKDAEQNKVIVNENEKYTEPEKVGTKTIEQGDTSKTCTFENLLLYAPNGTPYYYYVKESVPAGYESEVDDKTDGISGRFTLDKDQNKKTVDFRNTYTPGEIQLSGEKVWYDFNNMSDTRDTKEKFFARLNLYRYTSSHGAGATVMPWEKVDLQNPANGAGATFPTFTWNEDTTDKPWGFTITNLDRYAPNGAEWIYALAEGTYTINVTMPEMYPQEPGFTHNVPNGYKGVPTSVSTVGKKPGGTDSNITLDNLVNQEYKSASIEKKWADNDYAIRPSEITVKLQYKVNGDTLWSDVTLSNLKNSSIVKSDIDNLIAIKLNDTATPTFADADKISEANENSLVQYKVTAAKNWTLTVDELPAYVHKEGTNKAISWRFIETAIGNAEVATQDNTGAQDGVTYNQAASYQPEQEYKAATAAIKDFGTDSTAVINELVEENSVNLKVTKKWANDNDNIYDTRPLSSDKKKWEITVRLQRTTNQDATSPDAIWENVTNEKGEVIQKAIAGTELSDNDVSITFEHLPVEGVDFSQNNVTYTYRAAEETSPTDYTVTYNGNSGTEEKTTTITNTLDAISLTAKKDWKAAGSTEVSPTLGEGKTVTLELQKRENGVWESFKNPVRVTLDGTADGNEHGLNYEPDSWTASFNGLPKSGEYRVVEVDKNGNSSVPEGFWKTEEESAGQDGDTANKKTTITNTRTGFRLEKTDTAGAEIPTDYTVSYGIYKDSVTANNKVATWTKKRENSINAYTVTMTNNSTVVSVGSQADCPLIEGLPIGEYILHEEEAPAGYEAGPDIAITIGKDGVVAFKGKAAESAAAITGTEAGKQMITVKDAPIALTLKKVAQGGTDSIDSTDPAEFTVTGTFADGNTEKEEITSGNIGTLNGLWIAGREYTFTETKAPAGYELAEPFKITIDDNGNITNIESVKAGGTAPATGKGSADLVVSDKKIELTLNKVSDLTNIGGSALTGAEFTLEDLGAGSNETNLNTVRFTCTNNSFSTVTGKNEAGADASITITQGHKYKLTEVKAPEGYILPQTGEGTPNLSITFTVDANGTIIQEEISDANYIVIGTTKDTITVKNIPISLTLMKEDAEDGTKLNDAVFALYEGMTAEGNPLIANLTTSGNGNIAFPGAGEPLLKASYDSANPIYYTLKETEEPEGYQSLTKSLTFYINTNGHMAFKDGTDTTIFEGDTTTDLIVKNTKTKLSIIKHSNETKQPLAGATLQILTESGDSIDGWDSWITEEKAEALEGLPADTYLLRETVAPSGYKKADDIKFKLEANNKITLLSGEGSLSGPDEDGIYTITMTDTLIRGKVRLTKTMENKALEGVTFGLYREKTGAETEDVKIAENLITGEGGIWTSEGSDAKRLDKDNNETLAAGLEAGSYYFKEVATTADSKLNTTDKWEFTIEDNDGAHGKDVLVSVTNEPFKASITFTKVEDEDHGYEPIQDAQFQLHYSETEPENETGYAPYQEVLTSNVEGIVTSGNLIKGYYLLKETANTGYREDSFYKGTFEIKETDFDKTLNLTGEDSKRITQTSTKGELVEGKGITNVRQTGTVTLTKVDGEDIDKKLDGVTFKLMKYDDTKGFIDKLWELITGKKYDETGEEIAGTDLVAEGTLTIEGLDWGSYKLVETNTITGYENPGTELKFIIIRDGTKELTLATNGDYVYNYQNSMIIQKVDKADGAILLNGAEFEVLDKDGKPLEPEVTATVETNGQVEIKGQLDGGKTYVLRETKAPIGYELADDITFTMYEKGDVYVGESTTKAENDIITVQDQEIEITLNKADTNSRPITDYPAVFSLYKNDKTSGNLVKSDITTVVDGENPGSVLLNKALIGEEFLLDTTYILVETKAPEGYELADDVTFQIDADGNVINITGAEAEGSAITVKDIQTSLSLKKHDFTTKAAIDTSRGPAKFSVEGEFAKNKAEAIVVTNTDMSKLTGELIAGNTYKVTETEAPKGYELAQPFTFTLDQQGNIHTIDGEAVSTINPDTAKVILDTTKKDTLIVRDDPVTVTLKKVEEGETDSIETEQRGLAKFTISVKGESAFADGTKAPIENLTSADIEDRLQGLLAAGNTYVLTETEAPRGYELAEPYEFTVKDDGTIDDTKDSLITIEDTPIEAKLVKVDADTEEVLTGAEFTVTGTFATAEGAITVTDDNAETVLHRELIAGETYTISEVKAPVGYKFREDVTFTVDKDGQVFADSEAVKDNAIIIKDTKTYISFTKVGLYNESCADMSLGESVPDPKAVAPMEGVEFTAYSDEELQEPLQTVTSDANGLVEFWKLPLGTSYIVETKTLEGYVLDENVYTAEVTSEENFEGLRLNGDLVEGNEIINDVYRTTIRIEKVDEKNPDKKLANSVYGLYRRPAQQGLRALLAAVSDDWIKIAEATTDENGILEFPGVLMDTEYQIRELKSPDGSYVSAKPLTITFKLVDGEPVIASFDDGSGTVTVDPETGEIIWLEPQVEVHLSKTDEEGTLLAGARLQIEDEEGNVLETWESEAEEPYISYGKLIVGKTYKLVETKAPGGYELAEPVEFTIEDAPVGPDENKVLEVVMEDKAIEVSLLKTGEDGRTPLAGAEFNLKGTFADGTTQKKIVSAGKAYDLNAQLVAGETYSLTEVKAPAGYDILKSTIQFTVDEEGILKITGGNEKNLVTIEDKNGAAVILFKNMKTEVPKKPVATKTPTKPATSGTVTKKADVKTGDTTDVLPYLMLIALSGAMAVGAAGYKRRRKKQ